MKKKISIEGMSCEHCVRHVREALNELESVISVEVDLEANTAVLEASGDVSDEEIKYVIEEAGYEAVNIEEV